VIDWFKINAQEMAVKMEEVYSIAGISRQYYHKAEKKRLHDEMMWQRLLELVIEFRKDHPRSSARKIHRSLRITEVGINRFEAFVSAQGLSVKRFKSFIKTTRPGIVRYPNLINGIEIDDLNRVWSSDLTYFITPSNTLYIVLVTDVYSRRIIGYSASDNMLAINTHAALLMALRLRGQAKFDSLIHHSDKGSQYGSKIYVGTLTDADIKISMAKNCLENPYSERINGIIKHDYLAAYYIETLADLLKALPKAIKCYNNFPHGNLINKQSPIEFEENLRLYPGQSKQVMKLYNFGE
jgi:putative transposase